MSRLGQWQEQILGDLKRMFEPKTIALIGASEEENSVGLTIMKNLLSSSGDHQIFPVNPHMHSIHGLPCFRTITEIPERIDLAIIATRASTVLRLVDECGEKGVEGVIIVSRGFREREAGTEGETLGEQILPLARKYNMRVIGPGCVGVIRPNVGLNASLLPLVPEPGKIAFFSKSGALGSAMVDWAAGRHIGFSMFASLGSMIDIDFGDLIDFVGEDEATRSILIYMEEVGNARRFMSAARGFARNKPIVVMRPGRNAERECALLSSELLIADDAVYDAAFERAGIVRVEEISDLFGAAAVLDSKVLPRGPKLAVITNVQGAGLMAMDSSRRRGLTLVRPSPSSLELLDSRLPFYCDKTNPINLPSDSGAEQYEVITKTCTDDPAVDGVLVIYAPQQGANPVDAAKTVVEMAKKTMKPIITVWMGGKSVDAARDVFMKNDIPSYGTPEEAVKAYIHMYDYRRNLNLQYETPEELLVDLAPPKYHLKALIERAISGKRAVLGEEESQDFLVNYDIPVVRSSTVQDMATAISRARIIGYPVVLKVVSPDITHRTEIGAIETNIREPDGLRSAYSNLMDHVKKSAPTARISGVSIQKMIEPIDQELLLGARTDKDFGAVILFGTGGPAAEIMCDVSIGIPPLNQTLARRLMEKANVYEMLSGSEGRQPASFRALEKLIVSFGNLIADFPEIAAIEINPLVISHGRPFVIDTRVSLKEALPEYGRRHYQHLVITPYPTRYVSTWRMRDGTEIALRPIRPEDEPLLHDLLSRLSEQSMRSRFFSVVRYISHEMLVRLCNIDYDRHMAIVAQIREHGKPSIIGVARLIAEADMKAAEFAVLVRDDYQGKGLGYKLIDSLAGIGQDWGLDEIHGEVLTENEKMLSLTQKLGFTRQWMKGGVTKVVLRLR